VQPFPGIDLLRQRERPDRDDIVGNLGAIINLRRANFWVNLARHWSWTLSVRRRTFADGLTNSRGSGLSHAGEWEPHAATWLSWPRQRDQFPDPSIAFYRRCEQMVEALIESEQVCINVSCTHEAEAWSVLRDYPWNRSTFYRIPTTSHWCRDHGPIFLNAIAIRTCVRTGLQRWGTNILFDLDEASRALSPRF